MKTPKSVEEAAMPLDEKYGMGQVGEPKKFTHNKVTEVEGISNSVEIE